MTVPTFLSHLRRDRRGLPVPHINRWGVEDATRLSIRHDPHVGGPGIFEDDRDQTVPDFTRQSMGRQRECTIAGLCQVCARPVPWSRRVLVLAALSVERVTLHGQSVPVVTEPWLCPRCATFATEHCPALIRRTRDEQLTVVPVRSARDCQIVLSTGWVEGPCEAESRRLQPAMWAKILLRRGFETA